MASQIVKCDKCNIVINEVLSFIQNKCDVMDEVGLARLCITSFDEVEIDKAKSLLFSCLSKKKTTRRREGKSQRDIDDMISLMKDMDPEILPIFVARDLQKLPPVTFDHIDVTRLLKDIIIIQKELKDIQSKYETDTSNRYVTLDQFNQLKTDFEKLMEKSYDTPSQYLQNVNTKRGANCIQDSFLYNSGPMGLFPISNSALPSPEGSLENGVTAAPDQLANINTSSKKQTYAEKMKTTGLRPDVSGDPVDAASVRAKSSQCIVEVSARSPTIQERVEVTSKATVVANDSQVRRHPTAAKAQSVQRNMDSKCNDLSSNTEGWTLVQRKKSNKFIGKKGKAIVGENCKFRAAETNVPIYIYNVNKETCTKDIVEYIFFKTQTKVNPVKMSVPDDKNYDSYRMYIPKSKLPLFDEDTLWPEDIFFRRYYIFKYTTSNRLLTNEKSHSPNNG